MAMNPNVSGRDRAGSTLTNVVTEPHSVHDAGTQANTVDAILARPLPSEAGRHLQQLIERAAGRDVVYLSTPMTTGPLYLQWRRQHGPSLSSSDARYAALLKRDVLDANAARLVPVRARIAARWPDQALIDPTEFDQPGWQQSDYHRFWVEVISQLVTTMVAADGWQYSTGCAVESAYAFRKGVAVFDAQLRPLDRECATILLRGAAQEISDAYQSSVPTLSAATAIAGVSVRR